MSIISSHQVNCPYCGTPKYIQIETHGLTHSRFVYCDSTDDNGCDRMYAVQLVLVPSVQVYTLEPVRPAHPIEDVYDERIEDVYDERQDIERPAVQ